MVFRLRAATPAAGVAARTRFPTGKGYPRGSGRPPKDCSRVSRAATPQAGVAARRVFPAAQFLKIPQESEEFLGARPKLPGAGAQ